MCILGKFKIEINLTVREDDERHVDDAGQSCREEQAQQAVLFFFLFFFSGSEHSKWHGECLVLINITIFTTFRLS